MTHVYSLNDLHLQACWLTIGVFDGVHRGHQAILQPLVNGAHAAGLPAVVLTFHPHPSAVLGKQAIHCLTTPEERANALHALGVDAVITHPFDLHVASEVAESFMQRLKAQLGLTHLLVGYDFALGKGRAGNPARLTEIGQQLGYSVDVIPAVSDESGVISSTAIRKLIAVGDVREAAAMLGRPYTLSGPVIHGDARGREIGFPTANISVDAGKAIPHSGIYACHAMVDGVTHRAAVNIGYRPTFDNPNPDLRVEAYLLDFNSDLYGKTITLTFVERLRDELKFPSVQALIDQMHADVQKTRDLLNDTNDH